MLSRAPLINSINQTFQVNQSFSRAEILPHTLAMCSLINLIFANVTVLEEYGLSNYLRDYLLPIKSPAAYCTARSRSRSLGRVYIRVVSKLS